LELDANCEKRNNLEMGNRNNLETGEGDSLETGVRHAPLVESPYTTQWLSVPPHAPHGQDQRLGTLHPLLMMAAGAACRAGTAQRRSR
jgi:hypothetical protein